MASQASQVVSNVWDLSLYELHRKPHEMVADSSVVAVSPRALRSELMCPICLDLMKNTLTTKECLHRFCQDCIITALRSGNKECPTCRKKLVSKRSLRPDPNFDSLIAKIYPNREELNAEQERGLSRSRSATLPVNRRKRKAQEMVASATDLLLQPEDKRLKRVPSTAPSTAPTTPEPEQELELVEDASVQEVEEEEEEEEEVEEEEVELQLRPHPHDSSIVGHSTRNLSTIPMATVAHLIKYLSISPLLEADKEEKGSAVRALSFDGGRDHGPGEKKYTLYIQLGEDSEFTVIPNGMTLEQICEKYWLPGDKLKLYFARNETLATPPF